MIKYLRLLLLPFSIGYGLIMLLRNKLFDWGVFKSTKFELPVIGIGNLVVGGAGKTPTTEYLVRLLSGYKIAILSRGYGRDTKGFIVASEKDSAFTIGDEPMQYFRKFPEVTVAVCEDRVKGINQLKAKHDVILLDDAFQHRKVKAGFNILLFEFRKLQEWQFLLPAGNLRESFAGYHRADAILVTKSPQTLNVVDQLKIRHKFDLNADQRLSFSSLKYGALTHFLTHEKRAEISSVPVFLLTGIANPAPLLAYIEQFTHKIHHFSYPDHHRFSRAELIRFIKAFEEYSGEEKIIITTEKDSQRLLDDNLKDLLLNLPVFWLPVEIAIDPKAKFTFDDKILNYVANTKRIGRVP